MREITSREKEKDAVTDKKKTGTELFRSFGAGNGTQTRDPQLGRLMLYRLSYSRNLWAKMDSNHRSRKTADLQSAPFGHSGIRPFLFAWQRYDYYFNLQAKSCIFIAVTAASSPLLPYFPPARSSACCMVSVVNTPKMKGIPNKVFRCVIPCVTPWQT